MEIALYSVVHSSSALNHYLSFQRKELCRCTDVCINSFSLQFNLKHFFSDDKKKKSLNISGPLLNLKLNFLGSDANHRTSTFVFIQQCNSSHARTARTAMKHGVSPAQDLLCEMLHTHRALGSFHAGLLLCI